MCIEYLKFLNLFIFSYLICLTSIETNVSPTDNFLTIKGYCWREFFGIVPDDALVGGIDSNGKPIYIGQVLFENKLIPAKIYESDPNAYFEFGGPKASAHNVKILCTSEPDNFEWLKVNDNDIFLLTNRHLVVGGYEPGYSTYIGRIFYDDETTVGKVIVSSDSNLGLFIVKDNKASNHKIFEVLSYNPEQKLVVQIEPVSP